jgi:hypothetical protein
MLVLPAKPLMLNVQRRRPAVFSFGVKTYPAIIRKISLCREIKPCPREGRALFIWFF